MPRTTKYQGKKTDEKVYRFAKKGNTREQMAHNLGICKETFYTWIDNHPSFLDAIKKGEELAISEVENALYKRAIGYQIIEVKETQSGKYIKIEETKKNIAADVTAQIFILKNKKPEVWKDRKEVAYTKTGEFLEMLDESLDGKKTN